MTDLTKVMIRQFEELPDPEQQRILDILSSKYEEKPIKVLEAWYVKVLTLAGQMWWETPPNDIRRAYDKMAQKYPNIYEMILTKISVSRRNRVMYRLREQYYNTGI